MRHWRADLAMVLVTLIWGSTFVVVKNALDAVGPLVFVAARFWVASAALLLLLCFSRKGQSLVNLFPPRLLRDAALTGTFLALGFLTQTIGLQTTAAGKAAFITGLSVVLVPLFAALLLRVALKRLAILGVLLAIIGLGLLTLQRGLHLAGGDLWVLLCAFGFAGHILSTGHFSSRHALLPFTLVQMFSTALLSTLAALLFERGALLPAPATLPAIIYMGVGASALVFFLQSWAQRHTSPTHTALIFALEPVFAAFFALFFAGEMLALQQWAGCALILGGMLVSEVPNPNEK